MQKKQNKNKGNASGLVINTAIFFLGAVIIYLAFSIFAKLGNKPVPKTEKDIYANASEIIQVEVANGCGVKGIADRFTDFLRHREYDVVHTGNYYTFDIDKSIVIDRIGNMANAYKIAKVLGVKKENVIQQVNKEYFLDVTVVIGKDYFKLKPLN